MAGFLKNLDKQIKDWHILTILGILVLGYVIYEYSGRQNRILNNYQGISGQQQSMPSNIAPTGSISVPTAPSQPLASQTTSLPGYNPLQDDLSSPSSIEQVSYSNINPIPTAVNTNSEQILNPADLLPSGSSSGDVLSGNFLNSRNLVIGMESTVLRNANQSIRADPPIPTNMGPPCPFQSSITAENNTGGLKIDC